MEVVNVVTHLADEAHARACAQHLVSRRVAACVHVRGPLHSVYRWKGEVEDATEWELDAITCAAQRDACIDAIRALHPYELPAIMWTRLACSDEYGSWVVAETGTPSPADRGDRGRSAAASGDV